MRIKAELTCYYEKLKKEGHRPTEVQELTPGMFGTGAAQTFGLKGAETTWFLPYVRGLIVKHSDAFPNAALLLAACDALLKCDELTRQHPVRFPPEAAQDCRPGKYL